MISSYKQVLRKIIHGNWPEIHFVIAYIAMYGQSSAIAYARESAVEMR